MTSLDVFRSRRVLVVTLLGFSSGLPLLLTGQTLSAWLSSPSVDIDVTTIAAMSAVGLPYTFKWAWAPLLDRYPLPFLGRRRGWLLAVQLALIAAIAIMGEVDPRTQPGALAAAALAVAFLSASQDVLVDAFNTDTLAPDERAAGSATYVTGYRLAMLITGTLALALADRVSWRTIYRACAALIAVGVVGTLLAREPAQAANRPRTLIEAVWRPLVELARLRRAVLVLAFVALYRLGEQLTNLMVIPFLKRGVGFSFAEIATLYKLVGFAGTLIGGVLGASLVVRHGLRRSLLGFGLVQAVTNLGWMAVGATDRSVVALGGVVLLDNLGTAMGAGGFVAYLMGRCDPAVSATQYALLTSLSSFLSRTAGAGAGVVQSALGWSGFWLASAAVALPALFLIPWLPLEDERAGPPRPRRDREAGGGDPPGSTPPGPRGPPVP